MACSSFFRGLQTTVQTIGLGLLILGGFTAVVFVIGVAGHALLYP